MTKSYDPEGDASMEEQFGPPMTAPDPSDIDGPAGEAGDLIAELLRLSKTDRDNLRSSKPRQTLRRAASALAAYQAKVGQSDAETEMWAASSRQDEQARKEAEAQIAALTAELEQINRLRNALLVTWQNEAIAREASEASAATLRTATIEECAQIVENGQETTSNNSSETFLTPRREGNLSGLSFARAIRALSTATQP